ncbi:MAG: BCCT family transporter, partial [Balneolales bacterium]
IIIFGVTSVAVVSVVLGIDKGVKILSQFNIGLAALFLTFILIAGPTIYILGSFLQNIGHYLQYFPTYALWTQTYEEGTFMTTWTIFYWAWWISWSPYVGMFIARISKGRTIKEFVLGVLIVPTLITFLWMTSFGGSALFLELGGVAEIAAAVEADETTSLFVLLDQLPLALITSFLAIILVLSFFVTSSDSGSLVIDGLTSGGKLESPVGQRIFWATTEGIVAAVLLLGGGLSALQAGAISTGLPFVIVLLIMCYSLNKGLHKEYNEMMEKHKAKERESYSDIVANVIKKQKK